MGNRYESVLRSFTVRNMYEDTLATATDVVIPLSTTAMFRPVEELPYFANVDTNFHVRRVGLFCNFADGLVWKVPADRVTMNMWFTSYSYSTDAQYTITAQYGVKAFTTAGASPGWTPGQKYAIAVGNAGSVAGRELLHYITATGAGTGEFCDYWKYDDANTYTGRNLTLVDQDDYLDFKNVSLLNCMYDVNEFVEPFRISGGASYDLIGMYIGLNYSPESTTTFLTDVIDSAFDGQTVTFDTVVELEFTHYNS